MEKYLHADSTNIPSSPSSSFLTDADARSICPLITPSPPTNALVDPLPEPTEPNFVIGEELAQKLQKVQGGEDVDSIASSASSSAEPACGQLLNHRNSYHHIPGDEEVPVQETKNNPSPLQLSFQNIQEDFFFVTWNWPLIRKISLYMFLSGLTAMVGLVIAMIIKLPKSCNPPTKWYQGSLFYEIFPASFYSSNRRMEGDLKGISMKSDYLMQLGVKAVRLNSIFQSSNYPKDYENVSTLTVIDPVLGNLDDFKSLVKHLQSRNMSLILDLPVSSFIQKHIVSKHVTGSNFGHNNTNAPVAEFLKFENSDSVEAAMQFWILHGVEGFYVKGLENHADDYNTPNLLKRWKKLLGPNRILIVSEELINRSPEENRKLILEYVDLIDVKLRVEKGVLEVAKQIESVQNSTVFSTSNMPWIHWSLGSVNSNRLANSLHFGNATLGATLLQLMLPGTPSIFYGDEIGLHQIPDAENERADIKHLHQLTMMPWKGERMEVLPWIYGRSSSGGGEIVEHFDQANVISKMIELRKKSPSIYMNALCKQSETKANAEVKFAENDFLVIQRWYPRRKSYVVTSNLGQVKISADLSTLLYSGQVIVGPRSDSVPESVTFKEVSLWPGESVVIVLD